MTLQEKFGKLFMKGRNTTEFEKIADDFAIGFMEWRLKTFIKNVHQYNASELLEIYKKQYGL